MMADLDGWPVRDADGGANIAHFPTQHAAEHAITVCERDARALLGKRINPTSNRPRGGSGPRRVAPRAPSGATNPPKKITAGYEKGLRDVATRMDNATENLVTTLMERGEIDRVSAELAFEYFRAHKLMKLNVALGRYDVKHGGYLERDAIRRAVELQSKKKRANPAHLRSSAGGASRASRPAGATRKARDPKAAKGNAREGAPAGRATVARTKRRNPATVIGMPDGRTIIRVSDLACGLVDPKTIVLLENGKRLNLAREERDAVRFTTSLERLYWIPLRRRGKWNKNVRAALKGRAGVYAIRKRGAAKALYVGEGGKQRNAPHLHSKDPDRMMRTILRHFQSGFTPEKYARKAGVAPAYAAAFPKAEEYAAGGREWVHHDGGDLDVALYITPPRDAVHHEGRFIAKLVPLEQGEFVGEEAPF